MSEFTVDAKGRPFIDKDPNAKLDYSIDLTDWLGSDAIATVTGVAVGLVMESVNHAGNVVTAWLSGGTVGVPAQFTFHFTTAEGREDDRTLFFKIKER